MDESETKPKKITPGAILKKYNLTAVELDQLLEQIYEELEKTADVSEPDT
jgi:hypothetical protein